MEEEKRRQMDAKAIGLRTLSERCRHRCMILTIQTNGEKRDGMPRTSYGSSLRRCILPMAVTGTGQKRSSVIRCPLCLVKIINHKTTATILTTGEMRVVAILPWTSSLHRCLGFTPTTASQVGTMKIYGDNLCPVRMILQAIIRMVPLGPSESESQSLVVEERLKQKTAARAVATEEKETSSITFLVVL